MNRLPSLYLSSGKKVRDLTFLAIFFFLPSSPALLFLCKKKISYQEQVFVSFREISTKGGEGSLGNRSEGPSYSDSRLSLQPSPTAELLAACRLRSLYLSEMPSTAENGKQIVFYYPDVDHDSVTPRCRREMRSLQPSLSLALALSTGPHLISATTLSPSLVNIDRDLFLPPVSLPAYLLEPF